MVPDVVVVGAGIVGAACADALSAEGLSVLVLESRFCGGGATAAAMGHVVVMDDSPAQFVLTEYSRRLWEDLASELPSSCEDRRTGTLWIAADASELASLRAKGEAYRARDVAAEELSERDLAREEPNLRPGLAGALRVPGDRVVYPPAAARWFLERAERRGAKRRERVEVVAIGKGGVRTRSEEIAAGTVVNAAGAAAPLLTPGLAILPRKGHLVITDRYPGFCRHQLVELGYLASAHGPDKRAESVAFNLQPRATGQMLLGSSREFAGFDPAVNRRIRARMIRRGLAFMPALAGLSAIRTWVGFRPATPDNLPLVGRWPRTPGLFVAAGHEGLGVTTALGTARLAADALLGRASAIDPAPYAPERLFEEIAESESDA
ncbi:MAG TPA: FAD-binding oxidoreductase [Thermoanaerobaculia bacterium]